MNEDYMARLHDTWSAHETSDLLRVYQNGSLTEWEEAVFDVIGQILVERGEQLPDLSPELQVVRLGRTPIDPNSLQYWTDQLARGDKIVELLPADAEGYALRGKAFYELDQLDQALLNLQTALHLDPKRRELWDLWQQVMDDLAVADRVRTTDSDFENSPARQSLDRALDLIHEDEVEAALAECERARTCLPEIALAYNYLGPGL